MMYGQMTAGSWIYIGSQGIVQGTYETFVEVGRRHYGGDLAGRWILTGGLGGMGERSRSPPPWRVLPCWRSNASHPASICGFRPATSTARPTPSKRRWRSSNRRRRRGKPVSVGLLGNAAEIFPELVRRGIRPDVVTDQTSAHDPLNGYLPAGWTLSEWELKRERDPKTVETAAKQSMAVQVQAMLDFHAQGIPVARLRQQHPPDGEGDGSRPTPSTSQASSRPISGRCSAAASARSAGPPCRAIRRTSTGRTPR